MACGIQAAVDVVNCQFEHFGSFEAVFSQI
jgi:hypothetical protein